MNRQYIIIYLLSNCILEAAMESFEKPAPIGDRFWSGVMPELES